MLAHSIFGHELGHPIAADYLAQEDSNPAHQATYIQIQKQVSEQVNQDVAEFPFLLDDAQKLALKTQFFNNVLQIRKRALEELISDAVGIFIFGPSAYFACHEFFWVGNWDAKPSANEWYPPSRMRIRLMLKLVDQSGFMEKLTQTAHKQCPEYVTAVKEFIDEATRLASITTDKTNIEADKQLKIAYDWMDKSLDQAIAFAKEKSKDVAFQVDTVLPQLAELIQRLELGVPPNEVGDPANPEVVDYRASLLAAWMFKLKGVDSKTGKLLTSKQIDQLHQQTLRAIEYVILQADYAVSTSASSTGAEK